MNVREAAAWEVHEFCRAVRVPYAIIGGDDSGFLIGAPESDDDGFSVVPSRVYLAWTDDVGPPPTGAPPTTCDFSIEASDWENEVLDRPRLAATEKYLHVLIPRLGHPWSEWRGYIHVWIEWRFLTVNPCSHNYPLTRVLVDGGYKFGPATCFLPLTEMIETIWGARSTTWDWIDTLAARL